MQWDQYLHGALWAYRNVPHETTGEILSFLLPGVDCRTPTEAALLPPQALEPAAVEDYREEVVLSLSAARELAAESIRSAQGHYKTMYDRKATTRDYKIGDWVLIKFPQEESGKNRKLSRPWHGPYRVVEKRDPDLTAMKVYRPQDGPIHIHQSRVSPCPLEFPAGYYWYGPGCPPKWVDRLLSHPTDSQEESMEDDAANGGISDPVAPCTLDVERSPLPSADTVTSSCQEAPASECKATPPPAARTRGGTTPGKKSYNLRQKTTAPVHLMVLRSGRAN